MNGLDYCVQDTRPALVDMAVTQLDNSVISSFCSPASPCPECTGDCDADADCQEGLACQLRNAGEATPHGCVLGGTGDVEGDYCVASSYMESLQPMIYGGDSTTRSLCNTTYPYSLCTGDCDTDVDCEAGLVCEQRNPGDRAATGCVGGGAGDVDGLDYCVLE